MKLVRIGPMDVFHRYLTPKWAFLSNQRSWSCSRWGTF